MDLQLKGKRALVTGSSAGIGEGIAKALAEEGAEVVVHGRNEKEARRVAQEIGSRGGKSLVVIGDLGTAEGAREVADTALSKLNGVDILINNAGAYPVRGWMNTTPEQWAELYNNNVVSMVRMIGLIVPQMKKLGWGRIIQIASGAGTAPPAGVPDYSATKAANVAMTVSLAKELAGTGITVNTVSPGPIVTSGWKQFALDIAAAQGWGTDFAEVEQKMLKGMLSNPAGRLGRVEDVAHLVAFVASPRAGYINGANLRVDGGFVPSIN